MIGDTRCDRFDEEKKEDDTYIHGGTIKCKVSSDINAGMYGAKAKN